MSSTGGAVSLNAGFSAEAFKLLSGSRRDPDWVQQRRRAGWQTFQNLDFPNRGSEEWKRTDIRSLGIESFLTPGLEAERDGGPDAADFPVHLRAEDTGGSLVQLNGLPVVQRLDEQLRARGVVFCSMDQAVREHGRLVEPNFLTRCLNPAYDKFSALHAAFWVGGTFLYVPRGVRVEKPLSSLSGLAGAARTDSAHTLIILEEGAEATLLQEQSSFDPEQDGLHVGANEVLLGPGAVLRYVNLQNWGPRVWHFAHQRALLDSAAQLQWVVGGLGARLAKVNQEVVLQGRGAEANVHGVMFTTGRQHQSYHTRQVHVADHARSDLLYKGALKDSSRIVWRGMIRVEPEAQKTDAYQRNDNLMLSPNARSDSIPGLEIEADDVRCTHGATAGRVDEEQIFYCMARGLSQMEAMHVIVEGFFGSVLDRIPIDGVRAALAEAVSKKLGFL